MAVNARVLAYKRSDEVVEAWQVLKGTDDDGDGKDDRRLARACVGTLSVGGHTFDTFERLGGYVHLDGGRTYRCRMEVSPTKNVTYYLGGVKHTEKRKQFRPQGHGKWSSENERPAAILIHPGKYPYHFVGCIGVGFRDAGKNYLRDSWTCLEVIFDLCGGFAEGKEVQLSVEGHLPK